MSNIRIDSPPTIDNTQKIIIGRFIKNELSASMLPESRLSILEHSAQSCRQVWASQLKSMVGYATSSLLMVNSMSWLPSQASKRNNAEHCARIKCE